MSTVSIQFDLPIPGKELTVNGTARYMRDDPDGLFTDYDIDSIFFRGVNIVSVLDFVGGGSAKEIDRLHEIIKDYLHWLRKYRVTPPQRIHEKDL